MIASLVFMVAMLLVGWYTVFRVNFDSAVVIASVIGTAAVALGFYGWSRYSLYFVAGGSLGAGLLFPSIFGIAPMFIGFVLFILLVSLRMFTDTFDN